MKKKVLAALMAMLMVIGVVGCGSDSGTSASSMPPETRPTESSVIESEEEITDEYGRIYDAELGIYVYPSTESEKEESTSTPGSDRTGARPGAEYDDEWTTESGSTTQSNAATGADVSGIIVRVMRHVGIGTDYAIFLLDPETGDYKELSCFSHRNTEEGYLDAPYAIYYQNGRAGLSQDVTKLAMTYVDNSTKLHHAGWIDSNGTFFDIPEAVGLKTENEFVAQPHYYSLGFTKDGNYFVFAEITDPHSSLLKYESDFDKFYYVALNDLSTVYEGNPLSDEAKKGYKINFPITDWISDSEYLVDNKDNCIIRDANNYSNATEFIPGETRRNYNAVVGPDGCIAFASCIKQTGEDLAIYVTDRDGNNPQRILDCSVFTAPDGKFPDGYVTIQVVQWK